MDIRIDECIIDEAAPSRINKIWANHCPEVQKHRRGQACNARQGSRSTSDRRESHHFAFKRGSPCPFHGVFGGGWCEVVVDPKGDEDPITARNRSAESIHSLICGGAPPQMSEWIDSAERLRAVMGSSSPLGSTTTSHQPPPKTPWNGQGEPRLKAKWWLSRRSEVDRDPCRALQA